MALRWGIASTGNIANDFAVALRGLPTEHKLVAVAARSLDSATAFSHKHNIPKAYEGYDQLGDDPDVDVVYVSTINVHHYGVTKMLLEKGKNVLCEKPFVLNEKQARRLVDLARGKKLFLMEGLWNRCFPAMRELARVIETGEIGEVMQVNTAIGSMMMQKLERLKRPELGGGTTLTFGVYALAFQQLAFNKIKPEKIVATGHLSDEGVDASVTTVTLYPGKKTGVVSTSFLADCSPDATVYGTKGLVKVERIYCPTKITVKGEVREFPLPDNPFKDQFNNPFCSGFCYEAEEVKNCIRKGEIESSLVTHEDTIQLAQIMDKIRADVGVVYPADTENINAM